MVDENAADDRPAPPPPPLPPPAKPGGGTDVLTSLDVTAPELVRSLVVGALSYAVTWTAAWVCTVLVVVLAQIEDDDVSWWWLLTAPGQLVAMAFRSPATFSMSGGGEGMRMGTTFATTAPPLTILAVALIAVFVLSRRDERSSASRSTTGAVSLAAVSALTFIAMAWFIALILKFSYSEGDQTTRLGAAHVQLVLIGLAATMVVGLIARRPVAARARAASLPLAARGAWRAVLVHLAVFSALSIPGGVIWVVVVGEPSAVLALPAAVLNLIAWAATVGHGGALTISGLDDLLGDTSSESSAFWLLSDDAPWALWFLVLFAVIALLAAAVVLHERGKTSVRTTAHWVWAVVIYAAVGGALTVITSITSGLGSSYGGAIAATFGPAAWFCLVFAAWGALAELVARLLGPTLASVVPHSWLTRAVGHPLQTTPAGSVDPVHDETAAQPATPLDPRTKRILIAGGAVIAVALVAFAAVSIVDKTFFGPERQVEDYFTALSEGDAEKALGLARLDYSSNERVLLTDEILAGSAQTIQDVEVSGGQSNGDDGGATVTYTIDGAERTQFVSLVKSGSRFGIFDEWKIVDPGLGTIDVSAPGAEGLEVNGTKVEVDDLDESVSLAVFPGQYEITPTTGSRFLTFEQETVTADEGEQNVSFEVAASDALLTEVTKQAEAYLAECISRTEADPDNCPNDTYGGYQLEDIAWTLDASPTYSVESDYDGGWRFETATEGSATITAREPSLFDDEPDEDFTDTVDISMSGTVSVDGDSVTIEIDDYF